MKRALIIALVATIMPTDSGAKSPVDEILARELLLETIGSLESSNRYDVRYPNTRFVSFNDHPAVFEPLGNGKFSSAAGRYQITKSTWDYYVAKLAKDGIIIHDFSPENQDKVAWYIALDRYPGDLQHDLVNTKDKRAVMLKLKGTWDALRKL